MTLRRLFIVIGIVAVVLTIGVTSLWQYAYAPQGRARTIFTEMRRDQTGLRAWLVRHGVIHGLDRQRMVNGAIPELPEVDDWHDWEHVDTMHEVTAELADLGPRASPVMVEALGGGNAGVRYLAARACGMTRDRRTVGPMAGCLRERDQAVMVRIECAHSLGCIGGEESVAALIEALHSLDADPRASKVAEDKDPLTGCCWDRSQALMVRSEYAYSLGRIGGQQAIAALIEALHSPEPDTRAVAAEAIGDMKPAAEHAIPELVRLLNDSATVEMDLNDLMMSLTGVNYHVGGYSASALAAMGEPAVKPLIEVLKHCSPDARNRAAWRGADRPGSGAGRPDAGGDAGRGRGK